jgi:hypothetical protein
MNESLEELHEFAMVQDKWQLAIKQQEEGDYGRELILLSRWLSGGAYFSEYGTNKYHDLHLLSMIALERVDVVNRCNSNIDLL